MKQKFNNYKYETEDPLKQFSNVNDGSLKLK